MSIVQTDVPVTAERVGTWLRELTEAYPFLETELLARTAFSRPIYAVTIGQGDRRVLYSAAHHANEWLTATVLLKFIEDYAEALQNDGDLGGVNARELYRNTTIHLVPMVDPDGVDLVTGAIAPGSEEFERAREFARNYPGIPFPEGWKANLNGVDLNLQYPAGWLRAREIKFSQGYTRPGPRDFVGRFPLSQIEPQALYDYTERLSPELVMPGTPRGRSSTGSTAALKSPGPGSWRSGSPPSAATDWRTPPTIPPSQATRIGSSRRTAARASPSRWAREKIPCP